MRLVFIGPRPPPLHGQSLATQNLAAALKERGASLVSVDTSEGKGAGRAARLLRKARVHIAALAKVLTVPGTVYVSSNSGGGMWLTSLVCLVARLWRRRLFLHHHSYDYVSHRRLRMVALAKSAGAAATHIVLSQQMAADLQRGTREVARTFVLNNAGLIDHGLLGLEQRVGAEIVLGHLSNLSAQKGIEEVVELALKTRDAELPVRLVLAGPEGDETARKAVARARAMLGDAFDYRGAVYGPAKLRFFADITHFVFPTRYHNEASPLVLLEAMAAGVTCIATARGCIPGDLGNDGGIAIAEDADFVATALAHLTATRDRHATASRAARARFLKLLGEHEVQLNELAQLLR